MSDDKQNKDPKQKAFNKIQEQVAKDFNAKIETQVKTTVDALRAAQTEKEKLAKLLEEMDGEKQVVADAISLLK